MAHAIAGRWAMDFARRTPDELFAIAADIEAYPTFVPWCIATRILERRPDDWRVDNLFGRGPVRLRFTTHASFDPPWHLDIEGHDGPFEHFRLGWRFAGLAQGARVECDFAMGFRWELARLVARYSLPEAERRVVAAFRARAETLYGAD